MFLVCRFMETVPLIHFNKRKMYDEEKGDILSLNDVLDRVNKEEEIYFLDIDGIEKDKPNLCTYQRISEHCKIWADTGPRVLGDVVDVVMAGAANITVRKNLWSELDISSIRDVTENEIYVFMDLKSHDLLGTEISLYNGVDGLVIFNNKNQVERDFKAGGFLKNLSGKYKIYVQESNPKNFSYWDSLGVTGLLVDMNTIKEFNKYGF